MDCVGDSGGGLVPFGRRLRGSRRPAIGIVAAVAAVAVMLMTAGGAQAVPRSFFGAVPWGGFQGADYQRLEQAKVRNARTLFFWPVIEPAKGEFHWDATDQLVGNLAATHVRVLPFLHGSPSWVASDVTRPPLGSKRAKRAWKQFVRACVERYGRKGTFWRAHPDLPRVPITTWQIWNEQNNTKYFAPRPRPRAYAKLLRLAGHAARSADKRARIALGGMARDPDPKRSIVARRYLNELYKARGAKRLFNVVAVHPYSGTIRNLRRQMTALRKVVKRHHDNAKMWITEVGWGSAPPNKRWPLLKGVNGQKRMLKRSFHVMIHNRKRWHLKRVYWFLWRDAGPNASVNCSFCRSSGLFSADFQPKPAWKAFLNFSRR
jgi:GH35 family endo-1,4-beta-xylanase